MAQKRSCRRTKEEQELHNRAVAIRKMTDRQLCEKWDKHIEASYKKGYREGKLEAGEDRLPAFMGQVQTISGVGPSIYKKLKILEKTIYES